MNRYQEFEIAFGTRVRELRKSKNLSQADLAYLADIEQNQVYRVENARHGVTLSTIVAIAVALGIYPDELLKTNVKLKLNKNFDLSKVKRLPVTATLQKVLASGFLDSAKSVGEIAVYCKSVLGLKVNSSSISGALKKLVNRKVIVRIPAPQKGRFLYKKAG